MDSKDKDRREWVRLYKSFAYAINGLFSAFKRERNLQIHVVIAIIIIIMGTAFHITVSEWIIITSLIGGILSFELMNTAIERVVDLITDEYHPLAKLAKDISAASVFVFAITAVIIGMIIFIPYILRLVSF